MNDYEICILRWRDIDHQRSFLVHSHYWRWTAYNGLKEIPENTLAQSDLVSYSAFFLTPDEICLERHDRIKRDSYLQILTTLLKTNWRPISFTSEGYISTFYRDL